VRDRVVTDPDRIRQPSSAISTPRFSTAKRARSIAARPRTGRPYGEGDTVWMGAADASGSSSPTSSRSIGNSARGSCCRDRRADAKSRRELFARSGALNALAPGRLPFHTLNPALACSPMAASSPTAPWAATASRRRKPRCSRGTCAIARRSTRDRRPRWLLGRTWGSTHTNLRMEARFDGALVERLLAAGHDVEVLPDAYSDVMGHAGAVVLHPDGTLEGGPRSARRRRGGGGLASPPAACRRTVIPRLHSAAVRDIVPCRRAAAIGGQNP
jgi:gamma-glutamyltranspeptidase/glutathione hydrolase